MDLNYFQYALKKTSNHKKSAIIWFRESGKSKFIEDSIVDYCHKNKNKVILVFLPGGENVQRCYNNLSVKLNYTTDFKVSSKPEIRTGNNNIILLKSYNRIDVQYQNFNCDFLLVDEFCYMTQRSFYVLHNLMTKTERILFSMHGVNDLFKTLDFYDEFYLNIVKMEAVMSKEQADKLRKLGPFGLDFWDVNDIGSIYDEIFKIRKRDEMLDYYSIEKARKMKLNKIKFI